MGIFSTLFGSDTAANAVKGTMEGAGTLAKDIRSAITGEVSPEKKAEIELKTKELEQKLMIAQTEINKIEASSGSLFVSGGRPAILWVCVFALFYNFVARPLCVGFGLSEMPEIDASSLWPIMGGILGIGGMRSWEKSKGVNNKHG